MPQNSFPWTGDEAPTWDDIQDKPTTFAPVAATATVVGGVKLATAVPNSAAVDVAGIVANFNTLLANLRTAGTLAP